MRVHSKTVIINRRNFKSIQLSICRSFRGPDGRSTKEVLASFKTIRSTDLDNPIVQREFWSAFESAALRLILTRGAMVNNLAEVRAKFERIVPKPIVKLPNLIATAKPPVVPDVEKLQEKYPILRSS